MKTMNKYLLNETTTMNPPVIFEGRCDNGGPCGDLLSVLKTAVDINNYQYVKLNLLLDHTSKEILRIDAFCCYLFDDQEKELQLSLAEHEFVQGFVAEICKTMNFSSDEICANKALLTLLKHNGNHRVLLHLKYDADITWLDSLKSTEPAWLNPMISASLIEQIYSWEGLSPDYKRPWLQ